MANSSEQIWAELKNHESDTEQYQQLLTQLIEKILCSRRICRPLKGKPLFGIYQQIYDCLYHNLREKIGQELEAYSLNKLEMREWSNQLLYRVYREVLNDDNLKELALAAQQQEPGTNLRRYALNELVEAIKLSGKLCRPQRQFSAQSPQFYDSLYQEAVNRTLAYVYQKIDTYDPDRGTAKRFLNWVNFRLDKMMIECRREFNQPMTIPSLDDLDQITKSKQIPVESKQVSPSPWSVVEPAEWEIVKELIEEDPQGMFTQEHIRHHPKANFKAIALARFNQKSWRDISEQWGISISTLSSFFERSCRKFRPIFQRNLLANTMSNY